MTLYVCVFTYVHLFDKNELHILFHIKLHINSGVCMNYLSLSKKQISYPSVGGGGGGNGDRVWSWESAFN